MQLREPETLRMLDEHDGGIRHVDSHFDHRRGDEQIDLGVAKPAHRIVALIRGDTTVQQRESPVRERAAGERLVHRRRRPEISFL